MAPSESPNKRQRTEENLGQMVDRRNNGKANKNKQERIPDCLRFLTRSDKDRFISEELVLNVDYEKEKVQLKAGTYEAIRFVKLQDGNEFDLTVSTLRLQDWRPICELLGFRGASKHKKNIIRILLHKAFQQEQIVSGTSGAVGFVVSDKKRRRLNTMIRVINHLFSPELQELFLTFNDSRNRAVIESGAGSNWQRFYELLEKRCFPDDRSNSVSGLIAAGSLTPSSAELGNSQVSAHESQVSALGTSEFTERVNSQQGGTASLISPQRETHQTQDSQSGYQNSENLLAPTQETQEITLNQPSAPSQASISWDLDGLESSDESESESLSDLDKVNVFTSIEYFDLDKYKEFMAQYDPIDPTDYVKWPVQELKKVIDDLVKTRQQLYLIMHESGTHDSQPYDFVQTALRRCKTITSIGECALSYYHWKSKECQGYDGKFYPFLRAALKGDSQNVSQMLDDDEEENTGKYVKKDSANLEKIGNSMTLLADTSANLNSKQLELVDVNTELKKEQLETARYSKLQKLYNMLEQAEAQGQEAFVTHLRKKIEDTQNKMMSNV